MSRIQLPQVTLLCADCVDADRAIDVIERCKACCDFGAVKLLTSKDTTYAHKVEIPHIGSLNHYSIFILKRVHEFVDTPHMLIVQWDGFILNQDAWDPEWLSLDYIGPLFQQRVTVGSGGFSLRTKRFMVRASEMTPLWDGTPQDAERVQSGLYYEDGVVSLTLRSVLEAEGFRYATVEQAARFAQGGNNDPAYYVERPFGFHRRWPNINLETGVVSPPPFF